MIVYKKLLKKVTTIFFITIIYSLTLSSCSYSNTSEDICKQFINAVVELQVRNNDNEVVGNATGTVISEDGLILTNRHVVRSYNYATSEFIYHENFFIRFFDEEEYQKVSILKYSQNSDLALLKMNNKAKNYFKIDSSKLSYGEIIHTIGNGNGFGLAYAEGHIAAPVRSVKYEEKIIEAIQLDLSINEGNSGGPLINSKGELVGIITFRLRDKQNNIIYGTCFALPINTIEEFIETFTI